MGMPSAGAGSAGARAAGVEGAGAGVPSGAILGGSTPGGPTTGVPGSGSGAVAGQPGAGGAPSTPGSPTDGAAGHIGRHLSVDPVDEERLRHAIASEALSELSRLSSYSPDRVSDAPGTRLARRTPATTPAAAAARPAADAVPRAVDSRAEAPAGAEVEGEVAGPQEPLEPGPAGGSGVPARAGRVRDAEELRRMLSGFQAGVRLGRADPVSPQGPPAPDPQGTDRAMTDQAGTDERRTTP